MSNDVKLEPCPLCGTEMHDHGHCFSHPRPAQGDCVLRHYSFGKGQRALWNARHQPEREAVPRETHNIISSHIPGGCMCADCGMKEPKLSLRECPAALTTPAPAEDDDPDDHLGGKLAAAVERELDRIEQRNSTRQDFTPAFDRELARKVIMAGFDLFSCRGGTTASGYQWMGLLETLGLDKARPVSTAPAVSRDEIVAVLERCRDREYNPFEPDNQTTLHGELCAILSRLRGEGE